MICKKNVNGWIFLDKPIGMSSNFALQKIRKIFGFCKAGYLGTLDPLASGFLPIALGGATKTIRFFAISVVLLNAKHVKTNTPERSKDRNLLFICSP